MKPDSGLRGIADVIAGECRATPYSCCLAATKRLERCTERFERSRIELRHRRFEERGDGRIGANENVEACRRDSGDDDASVRRQAFTFDQTLSFEPVEQPGHVGVTSDHPIRDFAARQPGRTGPVENPKNVVLGRGQVERLQDFGQSAHQRFGRALEVEKNLLFDRVERLPLLDFTLEGSRHGGNNSPHNDYFQAANLRGLAVLCDVGYGLDWTGASYENHWWRRQMVKVTGFLVVLALVFGSCTTSMAQDLEDPFGSHDGYVLSILAGGDMAGAIDPCGCKLPVGGLARRAGYARGLAKRVEGRSAILSVDAGRIFDPARPQSEAIYDAAIKNEWLLRGLGVADFAALNVSAADLKTLDPWRSKDGFADRAREFPALDRFVSANVEAASGDVVGFQPYVIREVSPPSSPAMADRIRVGFIGLTEMPDKVLPGSRWKISDPMAAARKYGAELRKSCDFLVVLAYMDQDSANRLEESIPGVDLIVVANRKSAPKGEIDLERPATITVADEAKSITEVRLYPSMSAMAAKRWRIKRRTVQLGPDVPDDSDTRLMMQRAKGASRKQPVSQ